MVIQLDLRYYHLLTDVNDEDVNPEAIPPRWPPTPESLVVNDGTYELRSVLMTSIIFVTSKSIKVSRLLELIPESETFFRRLKLMSLSNGVLYRT